jgi:hypothetical protein
MIASSRATHRRFADTTRCDAEDDLGLPSARAALDRYPIRLPLQNHGLQELA